MEGGLESIHGGTWGGGGLKTTFLKSTIPEKIFRAKWSNPVKLERKRKV